jgi:predicted transcriptional regulator
MNAVKHAPAASMILRAHTAAELMTANPLSLREDVSLKEAIAFLVDRDLSGAPVIDVAGRPVGVLTQSDILIHDREEVQHVDPPETEHGEPLPASWWKNFQVERVDATPVRDVMTPAVFCVGKDAPAWAVVENMRSLNVHRLFVVDEDGVMVGVITAMDVIRHLAADS